MKKLIWIFLTISTISLYGCGGGMSNGHNVSTNLGEKIGSPISKSDSTTGMENASVTATVTPYQYGFKILWHPLGNGGHLPLLHYVIQGNKQYDLYMADTKRSYIDNVQIFREAGKAPIHHGYVDSDSYHLTYYVDTTWVVLSDNMKNFDASKPYTVSLFPNQTQKFPINQ